MKPFIINLSWLNVLIGCVCYFLNKLSCFRIVHFSYGSDLKFSFFFANPFTMTQGYRINIMDIMKCTNKTRWGTTSILIIGFIHVDSCICMCVLSRNNVRHQSGFFFCNISLFSPFFHSICESLDFILTFFLSMCRANAYETLLGFFFISDRVQIDRKLKWN